MADLKKWFMYGAIIGAVVSLVAPWLIGLLVSSTGVTGITFSTYNLREQIAQYANTGKDVGGLLTQWVGNGITIPGVLITALGMGAAVAAVAWLLDMLRISMRPDAKLYTVMIAAHLIMGIVISKSLPAFEIVPLVFMAVTGVVVVYLGNMLLKVAGQSKLIPQ